MFSPGATVVVYNTGNLKKLKILCLLYHFKNSLQKGPSHRETKSSAEASLAQAEDLFNSLLQRAFKGELTKANTYE